MFNTNLYDNSEQNKEYILKWKSSTGGIHLLWFMYLIKQKFPTKIVIKNWISKC